MDFLKRAVFGTDSAFRDTQKLVVIGGTVDTSRRASASAWNGFVDSFFLTAHFSQEDYPYDWLLHWLAKQPAWARSTPFDDCRRSNATEDVNDEEIGDRTGARRRRITTHPPSGQTHATYYRGHWLRITRTTATSNGSELKIGVVARNGNVLKELVIDAKKAYEMDVSERVDTFLGLKTTSKATSSSRRFRDIQLHSTLSAWVENMRRLSGMIDAFQDISLAAPVNQQPGLTQKVAEMRADLRMQRERYDAFLQLTREYADRYLEDIKDEVHSQRALLDMLERRLDAAKQLRTDVAEMQQSFAKGAREGFQEVKAAMRKTMFPDDAELLDEIDVLLKDIQACFRKLDDFWVDEVCRVSKALKACKMDEDDSQRWREFQSDLERTLGSWDAKASIEPSQRPHTTVLGRLIAGVAPAFSSASKGLLDPRMFASSRFLRGRQDVKIYKVDANLQTTQQRCLAFLGGCISYSKRVVALCTSVASRAPFERLRKAADLWGLIESVLAQEGAHSTLGDAVFAPGGAASSLSLGIQQLAKSVLKAEMRIESALCCIAEHLLNVDGPLIRSPKQLLEEVRVWVNAKRKLEDAAREVTLNLPIHRATLARI